MEPRAARDGDGDGGGRSPRAGRVRRFFLGDEARSKEESRLVRKLDWAILTYCCLSYFFNYLDRAAFANAYVAGLQQDLGLEGSQYNVVLAMFTAGSVAGQLPHALAIQKVAPRVWLPAMVLVWAALTAATAACASYAQLCAVRFLQGLAEASTYSGAVYIIGCWYRPREIAKRTAIFTASGQAGSMFAGLMMTAIHEGLAGARGLAGWQWVFIVNGIITCPVALLGFLCFPDVPDAKANNGKKKKSTATTTAATTTTRRMGGMDWLTPAERDMALARLPPKRTDAHSIAPLALARRVLASPAIYVFCLFSVVCGALEAYTVQSLFLLWLGHHRDTFTQAQINTYPLGVQAVGIASNYLAAVHIDSTGRRAPMGVLAALLQLVAACLLLVPDLPFAPTFFAYYLAGTAYIVNPVSFGWANIICQRTGDDAARAVVLYAMNAASTCLYTFWGIALYPASDAPYWRNGSIAMIVVSFAMLAMVAWVQRLDRRTFVLPQQQQQQQAGLSSEEPVPLSSSSAAEGGEGQRHHHHHHPHGSSRDAEWSVRESEGFPGDENEEDQDQDSHRGEEEDETRSLIRPHRARRAKLS